MNTIRISTFLVTASLALASGGLAAPASSSPSHRPTPTTLISGRVDTPDRCIRLNAGDYNACNVGNSGRGDLPYRSPLDHRRVTRGGAPVPEGVGGWRR
jgi:hypothetical protein